VLPAAESERPPFISLLKPQIFHSSSSAIGKFRCPPFVFGDQLSRIF
jgi:hypothetical protein